MATDVDGASTTVEEEDVPTGTGSFGLLALTLFSQTLRSKCPLRSYYGEHELDQAPYTNPRTGLSVYDLIKNLVRSPSPMTRP